MSQVKKMILLSLGLVLTGCAASLPIIQNPKTWYQLGEQDALKGQKIRSVTSLQNAVTQLNQPLNIREYQDGWSQGLQSYCSEGNGYHLGAHGIVYNNICPDRLISRFDHAWQRGLRDYCTPNNGYSLGKKGSAYSGFCPPDLNASFQRGYNRGYKVYQKR